MKRKMLMAAAMTAVMTVCFCYMSATAAQWQREGNAWWYQKDDGSYAVGWVMIGDKWYYFDQNGYMQTGWLNLNGKWYFCYDSGVMHTGWLDLGKKLYYMYEDGSMATGFFTRGAYRYQTESDGSIIRDTVRGKIRYDEEGCMMAKDGSGKWCYLPTTDDLIYQTKQTLEEKYLDHEYASQAAFEKEVWKTFTGTLTEDEIQDFIQEMEDLFMDFYDTSYNYYRR